MAGQEEEKNYTSLIKKLICGIDQFPFQVPSSHDPSGWVDWPEFCGWCPLSIVLIIKNKIEKKTYLGLRRNAPRATLIVVVLAVSWRCGREEIPSCRGSMEEMNIDACLSVLMVVVANQFPICQF